MALQNTQRTTDLSGHILTFLEKKFLDRLESNLVLAPLGLKKVLPKHMGKGVTWTRFTNLSGSTTALTEGESPDGLSLASTQYTASISAYGQYVTVSDYLDMSAINDTMLDVTDMLSYAAELTIDQLVRNELDANGTQRYTDPTNNSSKANVQSGADVIASSDLKIILRVMRKNDVAPFEDGLYRGVIHPLMEFDLLSETAASSFIILSGYNGSASQAIEKGEIGTAFGIKLLRSSNIRADATSTNTYGNIFVGRNAFGTVDLESAGLRIITKPHGSAGTEDPLDQRATVGYKVYYATKLLDSNRAQILWAYNAG